MQHLSKLRGRKLPFWKLLTKFFEMVTLAVLWKGALATHLPLHAVWLCLANGSRRRRPAHDSHFQAAATCQGVIDGCAFAKQTDAGAAHQSGGPDTISREMITG